MDSEETPLLQQRDEEIVYLTRTHDNHEVVEGYRSNTLKKYFTVLLQILTFGLTTLLFHWYPFYKLYLTHDKCQLCEATTILIIETYQKKCKSFFIERIQEKNISNNVYYGGTVNTGYQEDENDTHARARGLSEEIPLHFDDGSSVVLRKYRYFIHKKNTFVWEPRRMCFMLLSGIESGATCSQLHALAAKATSRIAREKMKKIYGANEIQVPFHSIVTLILLEVFNPFYMFQVFTIVVWLAEEYYYYSIAIVIMSAFGITTSVIQTRRNQLNLKDKVESYDNVIILKNSPTERLSLSNSTNNKPRYLTEIHDSRTITPGDIVVLPPNGCVLYFDAVLLNGSCIVNESMLTGESVPITKTALPNNNHTYTNKDNSSNTLYCGTSVIQTRYFDNDPVKALVLRTGYNTTKGQLVKSILYPTPADFKFDRDSYKFIIILTLIALLGLIYTVVLKASRSMSASSIIIQALDIITIVIPPALPAAMTVGRLYAVTRLKRKQIFCLNIRTVNVSGSIDLVCFDKTGTLTEDGLDMWGVIPVEVVNGDSELGEAIHDASTLSDQHHLKTGMAVCHSLTILDGKLAGDPLDLKMFESTKWQLEEPEIPDTSKYDLLVPTVVKPAVDGLVNIEIGVVHQNLYLSNLQRCSVVVKLLGEDGFRLYCKGSPEMLMKLSRSDTIPKNLESVLTFYATKGYRVLAMSKKTLPYETIGQIEKLHRDDMEIDLEFVGLLIMENKLKDVTKDIIQELKEANLKVVMITGDNINTAVSVAKECDILSVGERLVTLSPSCDVYEKIPRIMISNRIHFDNSEQSCNGLNITTLESGVINYKIALTGETWGILREHYPEYVPIVAERGAVFARMSSDQKQQLIQEYQALGYYVAMCGDGANDCGALRAAHCGVSLSVHEASVAAAFNSTKPDISCIPTLLKEGRAALVTSFGVFKFMVTYSLTEFISVAILYYFDTNLSDFQFLFVDLFLGCFFSFFIGGTKAYDGKLYSKPPLNSLLGLVTISSFIIQMFFVILIQFLSYYFIQTFPWYVRNYSPNEKNYRCYENFAIFTVSLFQYVSFVIAFSHGKPYRKSVITNIPLMSTVIIMTLICVYITIAPAQWIIDLFVLQLPDDIVMSFIIIILGLSNALIGISAERFLIQYLMQHKNFIPRYFKRRNIERTPHLKLKNTLDSNDFTGNEIKSSVIC